MKAPQEDDPLRELSPKALRKLARQYKIKHFYRKSPASLRRAIRRAREQELQSQSDKQLTLLPAESSATTTPQAKKLSPEELAEAKRKEELKAYEEHRLRYLFMPSRFVHKGTHEEYLLEKDEELELPDYYQENELVAMPVDPYRFYVYWDFDEETLLDVRSWLAEDNSFLLRVHDVSALVFDGQNAHDSWDITCHPLVREWYLNAPVSGRDLIIELGISQPSGFRSILRSNLISIPPASVSPVRNDIFAQFVPYRPSPAPLLEAEDLPSLPEPETASAPRPESSAHLFFQEYVPPPIQFNPPPPPKTILKRQLEFPASPQHEPEAEAVFRPQPQAPAQPAAATLPKLAVVPQPPAAVATETASLQLQPLRAEAEWTEQDVVDYLDQGGRTTLHEWLGLPHEIRWLSDLPSGMSPIFFEHWIEDPYDRAVMVSYAIWPWEMTEYLPLGASDFTLRKFLGASLFSWFKPGGSERMIWWQQPTGGSENQRWVRPLGASEFSWSGSLQPKSRPERSAWELWPAPVSGRGQASGKGLFG